MHAAPSAQPLPAQLFFGRAAPWLASLTLHAVVLAGFALLYRGTTLPAPLQLELFSAAPAPVPVAANAKLPPPKAAERPPLPAVAKAAAPIVATVTDAVSQQPLPSPQPASPIANTAAPAAAIATKPSAATIASAAPTPPAPPSKTAARFDAAYLQNPTPPYPAQSRRLGEAGTVQLLVKVSAQGTVDGLSIHRSSGFARLDEAAKLAVATWRFVPARLGDASTADVVIVPIVFKD